MGAAAATLSGSARAAVVPFGMGLRPGQLPGAALGIGGRLIPLLAAASYAYAAWRLFRFISVLGPPSTGQLVAGGWTIARFCENGSSRGDGSEGASCGVVYNYQFRRNNGSIIRMWNFSGSYHVNGDPLGRFAWRATRNGSSSVAAGGFGGRPLGLIPGVSLPWPARPVPGQTSAGGTPLVPAIPAPWAPLVDGYAPPAVSAADPPMSIPFAGAPSVTRYSRGRGGSVAQGPARGYGPPALVPPVGGTDIHISPNAPVRYNDHAPAVARAIPSPSVVEKKVADTPASRAIISGFKSMANYSEAGDFLDVLHKSLPYRLRAKGGTQISKIKALIDNYEYIDWEKFLKGYVANEMEDAAYGALYGAGRAAANAMDPSGQLWRTWQTSRQKAHAEANMSRSRRAQSARY